MFFQNITQLDPTVQGISTQEKKKAKGSGGENKLIFNASAFSQ